MKFARQGRPDATVELTPLIDVVFLLLIFFMVSTSFIRETHLKLNLPEADGAPPEEQPDVLEVTIDRGGNYAVNGRVLVNNELKTLIRALEESIPSASDGALIITADEAASHGAVVRAMDAAGKVGLNRLSITTQQPEAED